MSPVVVNANPPGPVRPPPEIVRPSAPDEAATWYTAPDTPPATYKSPSGPNRKPSGPASPPPEANTRTNVPSGAYSSTELVLKFPTNTCPSGPIVIPVG